MIFDVVVDTFHEDVLEEALRQIGAGRLVRDPGDPEEPFLTEDGYLVVRLRGRDPVVFSREVQRRVQALRVVGVFERKKD